MATIQEKIKGKKIVSFKIKACVGRDENGKQVFRCKTWYPPEGLTNGKARKEVQKVAILWEDETKQLYLKELEEGKPVAGLSRSFEFEKFVYEVWVPLCVRDGSHRPSTMSVSTSGNPGRCLSALRRLPYDPIKIPDQTTCDKMATVSRWKRWLIFIDEQILR